MQGSIRPTIGVALFLFGAAVLLTGVCRTLAAWMRRAKAKAQTTATVVSVSETTAVRSMFNAAREDEKRYLPKLRYTVDGRTYETYGQTSKREEGYDVGDELPIRYRPERPEKIVSLEAKEERGELFNTLIKGGLACIAGALLITL